MQPNRISQTNNFQMTTQSGDSHHIFSNLDFTLNFEVRQQALDQLEYRLTQSTIDSREALASYVPDADQYQTRVIEAADRTIRVLAPAGSGKTQTVVNRVLWNMRNGLKANRMLVLTFDNAAGSSIVSKLNEQLETATINLNDRPLVSTLNAFGYSILREFVPVEYRPVAPNYRERRFFREVKQGLKEKSPDRYSALPVNLADSFYLEFFSLLKNELFDPRQPDPQRLADCIMAKGKDTFFPASDREVVTRVLQALIWLYMAYERVLQREKLLDFDDQKLRSYLSLKDDMHLRSTLQGRFTEIIVDEFQDINRLDFAFIQVLSEKARLIVFGDDDQAIYGFRGCSPDFIIDLETHSARPVTSHELSINYRCPPNIVEHANKLIRHNTRRIDKFPIASGKDLAQIKVVSTLSAGLEAKFIVSFIKRVKRANRTLQYNNFGVLYRTNAQSLPLQVEFILNDVPYYVRAEDNVLQNEVLDRLLGVLRLKIAIGSNRLPDSRDAALSVRSYFRYLSAQEFEQLHALFSRGLPFLTTISSDTFYQILPKARQSNLIPDMQEMFQATSLMNTLDVLAKSFNGLAGMIGSLEDVVAGKVPLGEIYELAANFGGKIDGFVNTMQTALDHAKETNAGTDRNNGVALLTYFRAKGLQWHTVILTSCNEGLIPHKRAPIEEERRLFYVALTRTSANLLISYVKNSSNNKVKPSRFLSEAGLLQI